MVMDFSVLEKLITKRANFKNGKMSEFSDTFKQGFAIHLNYESRGVMKICLQKGKDTNYNSEKFNLSVEELPQKYATPLTMPAKKLQDINALMTYVSLPWRNYFEQVLNLGNLTKII
ncbi:hypothetical protein C0J52_19524 [Blattella germanica]|nr:hypothetical protein C0J52_19524 [Blattella germanica]